MKKDKNKINTPKFKSANDNDFFKALRNEVLETIGKDFKQKSDRKTLLKGILLVGLFILCITTYWYYAANTAVFLSMSFLLGILCLPLVLNIGHESVHHNFSTSQKNNVLGKNIFYLLGTSAYFWELRHLSSHHTFVNIKGWDTDIEQSNIIRLDSQQSFKKHHRFQCLYMPVAFLLYTIIWFFIRDFKDISVKQYGAKTIQKHPTKELILLGLAKIWHLLFLIIIPYLISKNLSLAIGGFFVFHLSASLITTFALISTHVGEDQEMISAAENGDLPYSWLEHQLKTTADFSTNNFFISHFFGGFNHHVAHHLFPNIPNILYPKITPIIKKYCKANEMNYIQYPNLIACAKSHFKRLKANSFIIEPF
jgi:linoleoyl-CoA desaturase